MFWDSNFWEDIVKNYLSSMATGVTLLIIGGIVTYFSRNKLSNTFNKFIEQTIITIQSQINQQNKDGANISIGSVGQLHVNNPPTPPLTPATPSPSANTDSSLKPEQEVNIKI